jgi:Fic family protein
MDTLTGTVKRSYVGSHPWLTFGIDLRNAGTDFWLLLGEARSKIEHLAGSLLRPDVAEMMNSLYLARGVHATTAIEGNTLAESDALRLVKGAEIDLPPSQEYLAVEAQNIVDAFNRVKDELMAGAAGDVTVAGIRQFNREVLRGLELDADVVPGEVRTMSVLVGQRYRGAPAEDCEYLLDRLCEWLNGDDFKAGGDGLRRFPWALMKAAIAHLYLAWIHPFGDGNGRTARLVELQILLEAGVPMSATHLLSNHYNATRSEYYRQLSRASQTQNPVPFLKYAIQGFVDGIRAQLMQVRELQWTTVWQQFIYETFDDETGPAASRRRELVLEMAKRVGVLKRSELATLTPDHALAYAGRPKLLSRDLNALAVMGLITRVPEGWRDNREIILAFLPVRRGAPADLLPHVSQPERP